MTTTTNDTGSGPGNAGDDDVQNDVPESKRRLLLVHGKDFKPGAEAYFDIAQSAIRAGIERDYPDMAERFNAIAKDICYYGDVTNALLTGFGKHYDEVLDLGDRHNALGQLKTLQKRKHFGVANYDRLPGKTAAGEFAVDIAASVMAAIRLSKPIIARLAKDVEQYWFGKGDYAESVRARVRDKLCWALDEGERILLLSHGSGCIVAYDVLWQLSHEEPYKSRYESQKVDTWITLGAPLGDQLVLKRLLGATSKGRARYPGNVVSWHNISAEDDYLCHDNTLADDFRPMLTNRQISSIRDYKIYNLAVRYGKSNPHSSIGYYIHPRLAQIIAEWLNAKVDARIIPSTSG